MQNRNRQVRREAYKKAAAKLSAKAKAVRVIRIAAPLTFICSFIFIILFNILRFDYEFTSGEPNIGFTVGFWIFVALALLSFVLLTIANIIAFFDKRINVQLATLKSAKLMATVDPTGSSFDGDDEMKNKAPQIISKHENIDSLADDAPDAISQGVLLPTICPRCHKSCPSGSSFCPTCGKQLKDDNKTEQ